MTTKKELIVKKYLALTAFLKENLGVGADLFPSLDEIDVVDLIFYINLFFETAPDYRSAVQTAMATKRVTVSDETFERVFPEIEQFLIFLRDLK